MFTARTALIMRATDGEAIRLALPALLRVSTNVSPKTEESITYHAALDFALNYWRRNPSSRTFPDPATNEGSATLKDIQRLIIAAYKNATSAYECDALLVIYFNIKSFSIRIEDI